MGASSVKTCRRKVYFFREMFHNKEIDVQYINSKEQIADMLTKSFVGEQFAKLRSFIGVFKFKV